MFIVLLARTSPNGPVWVVPSTTPVASSVAIISPWMFGKEKVCWLAPVLFGRMVTSTSPGRARYFSVTLPFTSVMKSGESPLAV